MLELLLNAILPPPPTPADNNIVPAMTSNGAPAGYIASASASYGTLLPWFAFSRKPLTETGQWSVDTASSTSGTIYHWMMIKLPAAKMIKKYGVISTNGYLVSYSLQGSNNGTAFTDIHSQANRPNTDRDKLMEYFVDNNTAYLYYRLLVTKTLAGNFLTVKRLYLYDATE